MTEVIGTPGSGKVPLGKQMKAEQAARKEARGRGPGEPTEEVEEVVEAAEPATTEPDPQPVGDEPSGDEPVTEPQE